jgi:hypothetical protein
MTTQSYYLVKKGNAFFVDGSTEPIKGGILALMCAGFHPKVFESAIAAQAFVRDIHGLDATRLIRAREGDRSITFSDEPWPSKPSRRPPSLRLVKK